VYNIFIKRHEGKTPLGRPRRRWEDNIRKYLREIGWIGVAGCMWLRIGTIDGL
jgi:hypothetical protein